VPEGGVMGMLVGGDEGSIVMGSVGCVGVPRGRSLTWKRRSVRVRRAKKLKLVLYKAAESKVPGMWFPHQRKRCI
jgi:hypothetical protein